MSATTEMEIKVSNGRILEATVLPDGKCRLIIEANYENATPKHNTNFEGQNFEKHFTSPKMDEVKLIIPTEKKETAKPEVRETNLEPRKIKVDSQDSKSESTNSSMFVLIEASKLSLDDEVFNYTAQADRERRFKEKLTQVIRNNPKDFYRPICDPSINEEDEIYYKLGSAPAKEKRYKWWLSKAKTFAPDKGSRLGSIFEYIAFLGVLMKKMLESGWSKEEVWKAVTLDSKALGNYITSVGGVGKIEPTGSREVCGFYDLGNVHKYVTSNYEYDGYYQVSGEYLDTGGMSPLASNMHYNESDNDLLWNTVGWIVFDKV